MFMKGETCLTRPLMKIWISVQYGFQSRAFFVPRSSWIFVFFLLILYQISSVGGSEQHRFIIHCCGGQKSKIIFKGLKLGCWRSFVYFGSLKSPSPCIFPLIEGEWAPWYVSLFLYIQCQQLPVNSCLRLITVTLTLLLTSSTSKDCCDHIRPNQIT